MDNEIFNSVRPYIQKVAENFNSLAKVYLFGSYAKNKQVVDSDIDIAFIMNNLEDSDKFEMQVQLLILASEFDTRIEPHPISNKDFISQNPFAREIEKTGIEIVIA
ncbi:MAG: nucleotidyltransferase domain-containing protein [Candidatus Kapabacteria bacterium]|nr:nucleotidyltransferase domain-containing protein [Candidatus Kapabacteria bacterium]